jgi:cell division protein FtsB
MQYGLRYGEFISLNTWQIQKLKPRVSSLEERVTALEAENAELKQHLASLLKS